MASLGIHVTRVVLPFEAHLPGVAFATMFLLIGVMALHKIRESFHRFPVQSMVATFGGGS
jgi:hypothetical protein